MTPSKTVSIEFPGMDGFEIDLCYLAREELLKLRKKCVTTKFLTEYTAAVIKGWKGLKVSYLEELLLVDTEGTDPNDELSFSNEEAEILMKNSNTFDTWVTEAVGDLENFTRSKSEPVSTKSKTLPDVRAPST